MAAAAVAGGLLLDDGVELGEKVRPALPLRTGSLVWRTALQITCDILGYLACRAC